VCADFGGIHKATASRIVKSVSRAIASLHHQYITFPDGDEELSFVKGQFYQISRFPKCVSESIATTKLNNTLKLNTIQQPLPLVNKNMRSVTPSEVTNSPTTLR